LSWLKNTESNLHLRITIGIVVLKVEFEFKNLHHYNIAGTDIAIGLEEDLKVNGFDEECNMEMKIENLANDL
jgi:hypothetical protein